MDLIEGEVLPELELRRDLIRSLQGILGVFKVVYSVALVELQELVDCLCHEYGIGHITLAIQDVRKGTSHRKYLFVIIPLWALSYNIYFVYWYVIHEFAHVVARASRSKTVNCAGASHSKTFNWTGASHRKTFKETEVAILRDWGMVPEYDDEFPKIMFSINGDILFDLRERQSRSTEEFPGISIESFLRPIESGILVHPRFIDFREQIPYYLDYLHKEERLAKVYLGVS